MTFSASVKAELSELIVKKDCCLKAEAYGLLLFAKSFSGGSVSILTENKQVAQRYQSIVKKVCRIKSINIKNLPSSFCVSVDDPAECVKVLETFGHTPDETVLRINRANFEDDCCMESFLRGAFLACGSVTDPEKDYHLEFLVPRKRLAKDLEALIGELQMSCGSTMRKNAAVLYFKGSESIEDMLTHMGAQMSTLKIINIKIYKDFRNTANRRANCETANITRTVDAAQTQLEDIEYISECGEFDRMPAALRDVAVVRRDNPEMSLSELGRAMTPQLSRSGVNHRLAKISELAAELRRKNSLDISDGD